MKKLAKEEYKHLFTIVSNFILLCIETAMFAVVWLECCFPSIEQPSFSYENIIMIGMYALFMFMFVRGMNGQNIGYLRITEMWLSQILAICLGTVVIYIEICVFARGYMNPVPLLGMAGAEALVVLICVYVIRVIYLKLYPPKDMVVIYEKRYPEELIGKLASGQEEFHLCDSICTDVGMKRLKEKIRESDAVILSDLPDQLRNTLVKYCYQYDIRTYVTPKISDIILRGAENVHMFYQPFLLSRNRGLPVEQRFVKRIFDIVVALVILAVTSPLFLLAAVSIRLCDGGRVIYRQERLTKDGKSFWMFKFRSMYEDAERDGPRLAAKGDGRITPVGKILRRLHIDELPQLINVLRGEMSIVGPRPERREIAEQYEKNIPEFPYRLKVKAGLTGYAQVNGKYNSTPYDKLKLDITYIENYSIWLDIKILLWTAKVLFQEENSEGVDEGCVTAVPPAKGEEEDV